MAFATSTPDSPPGADAATEDDARKLVDPLESMGPTFIKFGRSYRRDLDLLPPFTSAP